jgi:outer membrane protein OmpA-like peptidoglycan-associated protein
MRVAQALGLTALTWVLIATGAGEVRAAADCAPLGRMPNYNPNASESEMRGYASYDFTVRKNDEDTTVAVAGRLCTQTYAIKEGVDPLSDLEIQRNYQDQLKKLGATITYALGRDTYARLDKGGQETWFRVYSSETSIEVYVLLKQPHKQTLLAPSGADYRLLGHMPNYIAGKPEKRNFDTYDFVVRDGDEERTVSIEGAKYVVSYQLKDGVVPNSDLEIQTNYRNAIKAAGGVVLYESGRDTYARLDSNGQAVWLRVYSSETSIEVYAIEEKLLQLSIEPPEASALKAALDKDGRIALYVNFDFNKATLKPDAAPIIAQVVKLLKDNPALKVAIEGHTDNIGTHDYNLKLSEDRAAAVAATIVAQGIAKDRLTSAGYGPDKPVGDNATAEGRTQNRRVELVKS